MVCSEYFTNAPVSFDLVLFAALFIAVLRASVRLALEIATLFIMLLWLITVRRKGERHAKLELLTLCP